MTALYPAVDRALGAAAVSIQAIKDAGCAAEHSPVPDNWYHGGLSGIGKDRNSKIKRQIRNPAFKLVAVDQDEARRQDNAVKAEIECIRATESQ